MVESLLGDALSNRRVVSGSASHGWVMSVKEVINLHRGATIKTPNGTLALKGGEGVRPIESSCPS